MTERGPGEQESSEEPKELTRRDENLSRAEAESREKARGQGTEAVSIVKSKIREKLSAQFQLDKEGSGKAPKESNTKIGKLSRRKRGESKSTETLETQELPAEEHKTETSISETLHTENVYLESKMTLNTSDIPRKSLMQTNPSKRRSEDEEKRDDDIQRKPSEKTKAVTDESQSNYLISHNVEPLKGENEPDVGQTGGQISRKSVTQKPPQEERGNYMNNFSPAPLDEFTEENEDEKK